MGHDLRTRERESIYAFLDRERKRFADSVVLDYGCGAMPYRNLIESAGGSYEGYDDPNLPGHVAGGDVDIMVVNPMRHAWDVIVCTQVIQYPIDTDALIESLYELLASKQGGGTLLLTGPTNWPIVEDTDRWRFTLTGAMHVVGRCFDRVEGDYRSARIESPDGDLPTGWWIIATV